MPLHCTVHMLSIDNFIAFLPHEIERLSSLWRPYGFSIFFSICSKPATSILWYATFDIPATEMGVPTSVRRLGGKHGRVGRIATKTKMYISKCSPNLAHSCGSRHVQPCCSWLTFLTLSSASCARISRIACSLRSWVFSLINWKSGEQAGLGWSRHIGNCWINDQTDNCMLLGAVGRKDAQWWCFNTSQRRRSAAGNSVAIRWLLACTAEKTSTSAFTLSIQAAKGQSIKPTMKMLS